jgi:cellobiose phosphorylase
MLSAQGGKAGAWFECYADRPVPPLPPLGIVPWTWAEIVMFFVHHLVGVRPSKNELTIRPRLLSSMNNASTSLTLRGQRVEISILRSGKEPGATVDGKRVPLVNGELKLPLPQKALEIEINV